MTFNQVQADADGVRWLLSEMHVYLSFSYSYSDLLGFITNLGRKSEHDVMYRVC